MDITWDYANAREYVKTDSSWHAAGYHQRCRDGRAPKERQPERARNRRGAG